MNDISNNLTRCPNLIYLSINLTYFIFNIFNLFFFFTTEAIQYLIYYLSQIPFNHKLI